MIFFLKEKRDSFCLIIFMGFCPSIVQAKALFVLPDKQNPCLTKRKTEISGKNFPPLKLMNRRLTSSHTHCRWQQNYLSCNWVSTNKHIQGNVLINSEKITAFEILLLTVYKSCILVSFASNAVACLIMTLGHKLGWAHFHWKIKVMQTAKIISNELASVSRTVKKWQFGLFHNVQNPNIWIAWQAGWLAHCTATPTEGHLKNVTIWTCEMDKKWRPACSSQSRRGRPWGLSSNHVSRRALTPTHWSQAAILSKESPPWHMLRTHTHIKMRKYVYFGGKLAIRRRKAGEFWQPWAEGLCNSQMVWWTAGHSCGTQWMRHKLCLRCFTLLQSRKQRKLSFTGGTLI